LNFLTWFAESPSELKRLEQLVEQIRSNPGLMPSPPKKGIRSQPPSKEDSATQGTHINYADIFRPSLCLRAESGKQGHRF
jgi:hypothetical protein